MSRGPRIVWAVGWLITLTVTAFMLRDVGPDLRRLPWVVSANATLGIPASAVFPIGVIGLMATLAYVLPWTSVLGAILLSGFLGGAIVTHVRVGGDLVGDIGENVAIGLFAWAGLWLRDPRLRALLPVARGARTDGQGFGASPGEPRDVQGSPPRHLR